MSSHQTPIAWDRFRSDIGFVYFIGSEVLARVKIGHAKNPIQRGLDLATGSPVPLRLYALEPGRIQDEKALHRRFKACRTHGEWFDLAPTLRAYIHERRLPEIIGFEGPLLEPPRYRAVLNHLDGIGPNPPQIR